MAESFRYSPAWQYLMNIFWLCLGVSLAFAEDATLFRSIPVVGDYLYHVNNNWRFVMQIMFGVVVVVHIGVALYAGHLAMSFKMSSVDTIKWVLQTALMGIFSVNLLREQCKEMKKIP